MPKVGRDEKKKAAAPSISRGSRVLYDVVDFLQRRKLDVPSAIAAACPQQPPPPSTANHDPTATAEFTWAMAQLAGLKERERRAIERFVKKRAAGGGGEDEPGASSSSAAVVADGSDADDDARGSIGPPSVRGGKWPADVEYTNDYAWGSDVPAEMRLSYRPDAWRKRPPIPCSRTFSAVINESGHPANGQCGLFAARKMDRGAWVIDYVGAISLGEHEDKTSDYVCDFGEHSELALDANKKGNEARFVNDYRNTGKRANVEFKLRRDRKGELRQGVFVCAKGGVVEGEELLISYGKSYWRSRVDGSMEDFITRRPGESSLLF